MLKALLAIDGVPASLVELSSKIIPLQQMHDALQDAALSSLETLKENNALQVDELVDELDRLTKDVANLSIWVGVLWSHLSRQKSAQLKIKLSNIRKRELLFSPGAS
jgi:hypothetical protein